MKHSFRKYFTVAFFVLTCFHLFSQSYDTTRMYRVMAKARRGEPITIVALGGSITQGSLASSEGKRWVSIVANWWKQTFPLSTITIVNSGIGATGSDFGVHRLERDVFSKNPDVIIVEFSVNDRKDIFSTETMEAIVRQIYNDARNPAVMILSLKKQDGSSAKIFHKVVADYYKVPFVNYADKIDSYIQKDKLKMSDLYVDGIHPNDIGMSYIARLMIEELQTIYNKLPIEYSSLYHNTILPKPLIDSKFDNTYLWGVNDISPIENKGWTTTSSGWHSNKINSEMSFEFYGNTISLLISSHNTLNRGKVRVWIDNQIPIRLNSYWSNVWGPSLNFAVIDSCLSDGKHVIHIKNIGKSVSYSKSAYFEFATILTASKHKIVHPVAKIRSINNTMLLSNNNTFELDASKSFDNSGIGKMFYRWYLLSKPNNSKAFIQNDTAVLSHIVPDVVGKYIVGLKVGNALDTSLIYSVELSARLANLSPTAIAGQDTVVATNSILTLDGSLSFDPENDSLTYHWSIVSQPVGSSTILHNNETAFPRFKPSIEGEYIISLEVTDQLSAKSKISKIRIIATSGNVESVVLNPGLSVKPSQAKNSYIIYYAITKNEKVLLTITQDQIKSKIFKVVDEIKSAGRYDVHTEMNSFPKGSYTITLTTPEAILSKKLVIK